MANPTTDRSLQTPVAKTEVRVPGRRTTIVLEDIASHVADAIRVCSRCWCTSCATARRSSPNSRTRPEPERAAPVSMEWTGVALQRKAPGAGASCAERAH
jgi:hypothetical protein